MRSLSRRAFLAGTAFTISRILPAQSRTGKVLVTGGHPGDPEYSCGGTVARFTNEGHAVTVLYLNHGDKGCPSKSPDACSAIRTAEAQAACRILKATPRFANFLDGEAVVSPGTYAEFRKMVQSEDPAIILTHWPIDNHPAHRAASMLTYDAWRHIKDRCSLYYYEVSDGEDTAMFAPTDYVDITNTEALKHSACFAHASQAPDKFYALQSEVTHFRGIQSGHRHAEAFIRHVESPAHALPL